MLKTLLTRFGKKGQEASTWGHLGGWMIAIGVLILLLLFLLSAMGIVNLDFIKNARLG
ncbi:hypothetical protein HYV85_03050 [Candidatus Woesearchaeota archaeon]|nr:hypothetical protein [Candidatus Woesearchaeota archaeon]